MIRSKHYCKKKIKNKTDKDESQILNIIYYSLNDEYGERTFQIVSIC